MEDKREKLIKAKQIAFDKLKTLYAKHWLDSYVDSNGKTIFPSNPEYFAALEEYDKAKKAYDEYLGYEINGWGSDTWNSKETLKRT